MFASAPLKRHRALIHESCHCFGNVQSRHFVSAKSKVTMYVYSGSSDITENIFKWWLSPLGKAELAVGLQVSFPKHIVLVLGHGEIDLQWQNLQIECWILQDLSFHMFSHDQGGRTWQPFVMGKNGHENFRQSRIYTFRNKCVVFLRNRKFAKFNSVKYAIYAM